MKRRFIKVILFMAIMCVLCLHVSIIAYAEQSRDCAIDGHDWRSATCTEPDTCEECGETKGEALGHSWENPSCTMPKHCVRCDETEGQALGHAWSQGSCVTPKVCGICSKIDGKAPGHTLDNKCDTVCNVCQKTVGVPAHEDRDGDGECDVCNAKLSTGENGDEGLGVGAIVGIVLGSISILAIIVAVAFAAIKSKKK